MKSFQPAPVKRPGSRGDGGGAAPAGRGNSFAQDRLQKQGDGTADARALVSTPSTALPRREALEAQLGADLSGVRIHVGPEANAIVRELGALGATIGQHIGFAVADPDEDTLVHELRHVVQQQSGASRGVDADERDADAAEQGNQHPVPRMGQGPAQAETRFKLPKNEIESAKLGELGEDKVDDGKAAALDGKKVASAIAYNNKKWTGDRREQLRVYLGAAEEDAGDSFTEDEVKEVHAIQLGAGIPKEKADGMVGDGTMAILLETGFTFDLEGGGKIDPKDVNLTFFPGEFEDLDQWKAQVDAAKAIDPEHPYRHVSAPEGTGRLYVKHKGNVVAVMNARGGPAFTLKDGSHSADPTAQGSWKLGKGHAHTTNAWAMSQIAWGAPVRKRTDGEWEFQDKATGAWTVATGKDSKLKTPLSASDFQSYNRGRSTWMVNDFGAESWRIEGSPGQLLHTTPVDEEAVLAGKTPKLTTSHGCVHLDPAERAEMSRLGYLQGGVSLTVKAYTEHMLPAELRDMMTK